MNITVNGQATQAHEGETLEQLIARFQIKGPVAAQLNEIIIRREALAAQPLKEGDRIELLTMMGGG
ncbi:MAG: sulfur carrier protein ThiS [Nitrospinae bacterium]|nr:sulfur carrier protein ThiS [Nitrospinota bacterium]